MRQAAEDFESRLREGEAIGRIASGRMGVYGVFVEGTSWGRDLSKGAGIYEQTSVPGLGKPTAVAGHRTGRGFDQLVLSACHPLYSPAHRWVVFARLVEVEPSAGEPDALAARRGSGSYASAR